MFCMYFSVQTSALVSEAVHGLCSFDCAKNPHRPVDEIIYVSLKKVVKYVLVSYMILYIF